MLDKRSINSGDYCINLQVSDLAVLRGLPKEEFDRLRDQIVQGLLEQLKMEQKINEMSPRFSDHTHFFVDAETGPSLEPKALLDLIEGWSPNNSYIQRTDTLEKLFSSGIPLIFKNKQLSEHVLTHTKCHHIMNDVILPACKLSLDHELSLSDLKAFIEALVNENITHDHILSFQQQTYLNRVIFSVLYQNDLKNESEKLCEILSCIPVSKNEVLWQFYADAFFRIRSNYLFVTKSLERHIEIRAEDYFSNHLRSPLTYLKRIILDPMGIYAGFHFDTIVDDLKKIAILCQNVIEARWVISALYKVLPLYKTEDLDLDYDKAKDMVVSGFSEFLLSKLSFLKYINLKNSLHLFYMTGATSYLSKYEREFMSEYGSLRLDQQLLLQMEYCSVIYLWLINNDIDTLRKSKFHSFVESKEPHLIEKPLFSNIIVINDERLISPPAYNKKGLILGWLYFYIDRMYRMYAERKWTLNPFSLVHYRATSKIPTLRPKIHGVVSSFVASKTDEFINSHPSYACKIISLIEFARNANGTECDKLMTYISTALKSSSYEILLNAKSFSYILYYSRFYGQNLSQKDIRVAISKFKKEACLQNLAPRLYWAEAECVELSEKRKDQDFIISLHKAFEKANRKLYQLALRKGEEFNLVIPDECVEVIKFYAEDGSLLALTGVDYLMITEYWNLLATTIFNLEFPDRLKSLEIASMFYSLAKCFAREQRHIDQKYSYNYIRVRSLHYEMSKQRPNDFFIRDCTIYINKPNNQYFSYKDKCCEPFFRLINQYYLELPNDIREMYSNNILPKRAWVKKAFERMGIGVFSEDIKIK